MKQKHIPGGRVLKITRKSIDVVFYLILMISIVSVAIRTYRLVGGSDSPDGSVRQSSLSFEVMCFGPGVRHDSAYVLSEGKLAALQQPPNRYQLLVSYRSALGYYDYFLTLLFTAGLLYGIAQLRRIFHSISAREPFADSNAKRIRRIGLLLIAYDVVKGVNYFLFGALANKYFSGVELVTEIGFGAWAGLLILALSVVYQRGVELNSDTQLTI